MSTEVEDKCLVVKMKQILRFVAKATVPINLWNIGNQWLSRRYCASFLNSFNIQYRDLWHKWIYLVFEWKFIAEKFIYRSISSIFAWTVKKRLHKNEHKKIISTTFHNISFPNLRPNHWILKCPRRNPPLQNLWRRATAFIFKWRSRVFKWRIWRHCRSVKIKKTSHLIWSARNREIKNEWAE